MMLKIVIWALVLVMMTGCAVQSPEPDAPSEVTSRAPSSTSSASDPATPAAPEPPPLLRLPPPPADESMELETAAPITIELPRTDED